MFNGRTANISNNRAELLEKLMQDSSEMRPLIVGDFIDRYNSNDTYRQNVNRLKRTMADAGIPGDIIVSMRFREEPGYFYNSSYPFVIIKRTSDM